MNEPIRKWDIYLADLNPAFKSEPGKIRPVVVTQTNLLNQTHPSTIVCPISSQVRPGVEILRINIKPHKNTGLEKPSAILVDQIRAIDNKRLLKKLGTLTEKDRLRLYESLKIIILE